MKANKLNYKALALFFTVFFSSCNTDDSSIIDSLEVDDNSINKISGISGNVSSINHYFYNDFRLVKILTYRNFEATEPSNGIEYEYDGAGNLIKETFFQSWNSEFYAPFYNEYEYLGNKKVKEKMFTRYPGENLNLSRYVDYIYKGDLLIKSETYDGLNGSFISSDHYEYDKRGNLVLDYTYDPSWIGKGVWGGVYDTGIFGYRKYVYDKKDRLITALTSDGVLDFYPYLKYTYDNDGKIIKTEYHEYEGLNRYEVNGYYKTSKLLALVLYYDKNGNQTNKLQHFYDELGNSTETVRNDECLVSERKYNDRLLIEQIFYSCNENGFFVK